MRRWLHPIAALLLALVPAGGAAWAKDADPALWVVRDRDTTIYLFGTIHVLKPGLDWFDDGVKAAFDKSDEVALEMVMPDPARAQATMLGAALVKDGPTLSERLPEAERAAYAKMLADLGLPPTALDRVAPWFAAMTLTMAPLEKLGYAPDSGPEHVITDAAKAAGKPVIGLETFDQQIEYLRTLPAPLQLRFLTSVIDEYPELAPTLDKMIAAWSAGDPDRLAATLNEDLRKTPELGKVLLVNRNRRWARWIARRMRQPGTVFIAVGAGHLAGRSSVQAFLARYHLRARRVRY